MLFSFSAQAVIGDYNKPVNGTLAASEWNNLINDFVAKSGARLDGYFSINTATSSSYALDINGSLRATNFSGAYTGTLNAGNISAGTFGANTGGGNYNFLGNLGIGIGTSTPNSAITLGNNRWISALNSAGTGYVNMFRVNANDEIEVGGALNIGQFQFPADSGFNTFVDMPVTNSSASGTIMGYTMKVDGDNILNVYSESNGIGGVQNRRIGIGTSTPRFTLDVAGIINATALYVNGSPYIGSQWTTQGTSIYYNTGNVGIGTTTPTEKMEILGRLKVSGNATAWGSVAGLEINDMYPSVNARRWSILGGLSAQGSLDFRVGSSQYGDPWINGTTTMTILRNGYIGIGTTTPASSLDVNGLIKMRNSTITANEDVINKGYLDSALASSSATIITQIATSSLWQGNLTGNIWSNNSGNVGVGTTNPTGKLTVAANSDNLIFANASGVAKWDQYLSGDDLYYYDLAGSGQPQIVFKRGGSVGIGTTAPVDKLSVIGAISTGYVDQATYPKIRGSISHSGNPNGLSIVSQGASASTGGSGDIRFLTSDSNSANGSTDAPVSEKMRIKYNGNIGIGTSTPGAKLHVYGAGDVIIQNQAYSTGALGGLYIQQTSSGGLNIDRYGQANLLDIDANGNVGIGTTTPGTRLSVIGTGNYSIDAGNYRIGNVAAPVSGQDAVTKSYMDSAINSATSSITLWGGSTAGNIWSLNSGNVGVGTTIPSSKFTIGNLGAAGEDGISLLRNSGYGQGSIMLGYGLYGLHTSFSLLNNYSNSRIILGQETYYADGNPGNIIFSTQAAHTTTTVERMRITSGGNIGIGTTNPGAKFQVASSDPSSLFALISQTSQGSAAFGWKYNSGAFYGANGNNAIIFGNNAGTTPTSYIYISDVGNVGIGTTNPIAKLYVNGTSVFNDIATFTQPVVVGAPINPAHAATRSYVDSLLTGGTSNGSFSTITVSGTSTFATTGGNVGIGTTNPVSILDVNSPGASGMRWFRSGSQLGFMDLSSNNLGITATNDLSLGSGGASQGLVLKKTSGNVGIGTTTPSSKLDIYQGSITLDNNQALRLRAADGAVYNSVYNDTGSNLVLNSPASGDVYLRSNSTHLARFSYTGEVRMGGGNVITDPKMLIMATGNVGIGTGTTTPGTRLTVIGTGNYSIDAGNYRIGNVAAPVSGQDAVTKSYMDSAINSATSSITLWGGSTAGNIWSLNSGNVGIGITNPSHKLELAAATATSSGISLGNDVVMYRTGVGKMRISAENQTYNSFLDFDFGQSWQWGTTITGGGNGGNIIRFMPNVMIANDASMLFGDNSTELLRRDTSGGTGKFVFRLQTGVAGAFNSSGYIFINNNAHDRVPTGSVVDPTLRIYSSDLATGPNDFLEFFHDQTDGQIKSGAGLLSLTGADGVNINASLLVNSLGNVGIGTTTPGSRLSVSGGNVFINDAVITSGTPKAAITKEYLDSSLTAFNSENNLWKLDGSNLYSSSTAWNVGIGVTNPSNKLSIYYDSADYNQVINNAGAIKLIQQDNNGNHVGISFTNELNTTGTFIGAVQRSSTTRDIVFQGYTGSSYAEYLRISAAGNVGIGTTNPADKLYLSGSSMTISNDSGSSNARLNLVGWNAGVPSSASVYSNFTGGLVFVSANGQTTRFQDGADENLVITGVGNVGIGTSSPLSKLHIEDVNRTIDSLGNVYVSTSDAPALDRGGQITLGGKWATGLGPTRFAAIAGKKENSSDGNAAGYLGLYTAISTGGTLTEKMRISNSGNVGIGTTTPSSKLSLSGGNAFINDAVITSGTPKAAITKEYLDSSLTAFNDTNNLWKINGNNLYASSTGWNVGIGTTNPVEKFEIAGGNMKVWDDNVLGANLVDAWVNNVTYPYETFSASGLDITSAINSDTYGFAYDSFVAKAGKMYKITYDLTRNSGALPYIVVSQSTTLTRYHFLETSLEGPNTFYFYGADNLTMYIGFYTASGAAADFSVQNFSFNEINAGTISARNVVAENIVANGVISGTGGSGIKIDTNGRVGIGTTVPGTMLHIGDNLVNPTVLLESTGNGDINTEQSAGFEFGEASSARGSIWYSGDGMIHFGSNNRTRENIRYQYNASTTWIFGNLYLNGASNNTYFPGLGIWNSSGNVGIGTTTPSTKLHVNGTSLFEDLATFNQPVTVGAPVLNTHAATKSYVDSQLTGGAASGSFETLTVSGTTTLATATGNVGIGTTNPGYALDISNNNIMIGSDNVASTRTNGQYKVFRLLVPNTASSDAPLAAFVSVGGAVSYGGGTSIGSMATSLTFHTAPTINQTGTNPRMTIDGNGNVGIGTTTPTQKLDVFGTAQANNLRIVNNSTATVLVDAVDVGAAPARSAIIKLDGYGNRAKGTIITDDQSLNQWFIGEPYGGTEGISIGIDTLANNQPEYPSKSKFYVNTLGDVGISTTTPSARLAIVGGNIFIHDAAITSGTPKAAITKEYFDSSLSAFNQDTNLWKLSGNSLYSSSTAWNVGIGTINPTIKLDILGTRGMPSTSGVIANGILKLQSGEDEAMVFGLNDASPWGGWIQQQNISNSSLTRPLSLNPNGGNVGIGTTNPVSPLHVFSALATPLTVQRDAALANVSIEFKNNSASWFAGQATNGNFAMHTSASLAGASFNINTSGNVGIGLNNPNSRLHVYNSSANAEIDIQSVVGSGNHWGMYNALTDNSLRVWGGSDYLTIKRDGKIGIGTTNPFNTLDVNGSISVGHGSTGVSTEGIRFARDTDNSRYQSIYTTTSGAAIGNLMQFKLHDAVTGNSQATVMTLRGDGNVGIGTTDPGVYKLYVNGNTNIAGSLNVTGTTTASAFIGPLTGTMNAANVSSGAFGANTGGGNYSFPGNIAIGTSTAENAEGWDKVLNVNGTLHSKIIATTNAVQAGIWAHNSGYYGAPGGGMVGTKSAHPLSLLTGGAARMTIASGGNVGIGTTSPQYKLDIYSANVDVLNLKRTVTGGGSSLKFENGDNQIGRIWLNSLGNLTFDVGSTIITDTRMTINTAGNVGIGTTDPGAYRLKVSGDVAITGTLQTQTGSDFAEEFSVKEELEPGTVVVMDDNGHKSVKPCSGEYDKKVVGIVSDNPSIIAGKVETGKKAVVAMMGVVTVKASSVNGSIEKGDLITTSDIPGYAMKAESFRPGTIIGKALEDLSGRRGEIKVLVNLQ